MAAGWFRDTSDNKLVAAADSELAAPAGHDFILKSTIEAAYTGEIWQGGTWDGTDYTPPANIIVPFDTTTDAGTVKVAAHRMMDTFESALEFMERNQHAWPQDALADAKDALYWQIVNTARVVLNNTRSASDRQKFCDESASWPTGLNGSVREYVDEFNGDTALAVGKDWCWVNPEMSPPTRNDITSTIGGFSSATNVENAPSTAELVEREWINDIP